MRDAKWAALAPLVDDPGSLRARPVIGDDDVEVVVVLVRKGEEHHVERFGPFVRRDDNGE